MKAQLKPQPKVVELLKPKEIRVHEMTIRLYSLANVIARHAEDVASLLDTQHKKRGTRTTFNFDGPPNGTARPDAYGYYASANNYMHVLHTLVNLNLRGVFEIGTGTGGLGKFLSIVNIATDNIQTGPVYGVEIQSHFINSALDYAKVFKGDFRTVELPESIFKRVDLMYMWKPGYNPDVVEGLFNRAKELCQNHNMYLLYIPATDMGHDLLRENAKYKVSDHYFPLFKFPPLKKSRRTELARG